MELKILGNLMACNCSQLMFMTGFALGWAFESNVFIEVLKKLTFNYLIFSLGVD